MDITQLTYFCAVVEEGTISAAARKLHISQPPLSLQIKNLESEFGVLLFERGARQIRLTDAGRNLYEYAKPILELRDSAIENMHGMRTGRKGSVRLGIVSSGECDELFRGLSLFESRFPDVPFKLYDANTFELLDAMEKRQIELAVIRSPFPTAGLDYLPLRQDSFVCVGKEDLIGPLRESARTEEPRNASSPSDAPASAGTPGTIRLSQLQELPLIVYRRWERTIRSEFENEKARPRIICTNDDARTSLQWAAAGLGVALVPEAVLYLMPSLPYIRLSETALSSHVCLVRRTDTPLSSSAGELFRLFQELYSKKAGGLN